jgi:hypothetical protein
LAPHPNSLAIVPGRFLTGGEAVEPSAATGRHGRRAMKINFNLQRRRLAGRWDYTVHIGRRIPPERRRAMQRLTSTWPRHAALWLTLLAFVAALGGCAQDTLNGNPVRPNADNKLGPMS